MALLRPENVSTVLNSESPVRIAFLGGPRAGKSSVVSKLTLGQYRDTYYPTHLVVPILFSYQPALAPACAALDESNSSSTGRILLAENSVVLSPVLEAAYSKPEKNDKKTPNSSQISRNDVYRTLYPISGESLNILPILVELVDTPAYNPTMVVPFLEASLHNNLDRQILHRLADEPRQPVSTNPMLVASGASELNGAIDGYFYVYSAVPSSLPPAYDSVVDERESSGPTVFVDPGTQPRDPGTLGLLPSIKVSLDEAWQEYNSFRTKWELGKESDIFSIKSALKNMFKERNGALGESQRKTLQSWSPHGQLPPNPDDPSDPHCPPPAWILCTHAASPLASPTLVDDGKQLARKWKCGFAAVDCDNDVEIALALMIREIVERRNLRRQKRKRT